MWTIIGTWRMAKEGVEEGAELLSQGGNVFDALENAVKIVENDP